MNVDVFIHGDADFGIAAGKAGRRVERAPAFGLGGIAHFDYAIGLTATADLIMEGDIEYRRIAAVVAQEFVDNFFRAGVLDILRRAGA